MFFNSIIDFDPKRAFGRVGKNNHENPQDKFQRNDANCEKNFLE